MTATEGALGIVNRPLKEEAMKDIIKNRVRPLPRRFCRQADTFR